MPDPIPFEWLIAWADGTLPPERRAVVAEHLAPGCPVCQAQLAWLSRFERSQAEWAAVVAPPEAKAAARQMFRDRRAGWQRAWSSALERLWAALAFDSRTALAPAGLRGAAAAGRQLLYTTARLDVDVFVSPAGEGSWRVLGQLFARDTGLSIAGSRVTLLEDLGPPLTGTADALGEFRFDQVPAGHYSLTCQVGPYLVLADLPVLGPAEEL